MPPPAVPVVPSLPLLALLARGPIQFDASEAARIPAWLRAVVERLCALDPSRRYRSGSAVIEAINAGGGHAFAIDTVETRESYFFSGRFVGREREQDRLTAFALRRLGVERDASADAPDGAPAVAVSGPSGIGESRLMRELRREIQLARFAVVEANCYEDSLAEYGPVADAIAHVVRLADAAGAADLVARYAPDLARLSPDIGRERSVAPARPVEVARDDRVGLIDRVCAFLVGAAERAPFVLYVNDLQWARSGTIDVLSYLARAIAIRERNGERVRLAVALTYGDDETAGRPVERAVAAMAERGELASVRLEPLGAADTGRLIADPTS